MFENVKTFHFQIKELGLRAGGRDGGVPVGASGGGG